MSYRYGALQNEIQRGLVANFDLRRGADRVVKQNGVITGSVPFTPVGADLPGSAGNYVSYNIPSHLCDVQDSSNYLTVMTEFYPDLDYTTDATWDFFSTGPAGAVSYAQKLPNANSNSLRIVFGGQVIDEVTTAEYGSLWNTGGRNQIIVSSIDGDTDVWLNGQSMTSSDATAYITTIKPETLYAGIYYNGTSAPFPGIISQIKIFKGSKFTTEDAQAYWNQRITVRPEQAASYWFFDGERNSAGSRLEIDSNVVAAYDLPSLTDLTGNGHTLVENGTPVTGGDALGSYVDYDGDATTYHDIPIDAWPGTTGAMEMIIHPNSFTANEEWYFGGSSGGSPNDRFYTRFSSGTSHIFGMNINESWYVVTYTLNLSKLHHVVFQWEYSGGNTTVDVFVNGVRDPDTSVANGVSVLAPVANFRLGASYGTSASADAFVYQAFIHNTARTETEWAERANASLAYTKDLSRNERNLKAITATSAPTKLSKHGYSFDGGDYLTGSTEPAIVASDSITLECEFTLDDVAGFHGLISRSTGATDTSCFLRVDDGKVEFYFTNTSNVNRQWEETGTSIQFGQRYHIVFQHTFGTATSTRCFLNGRELAGAWVAGGSDQPEENAAWTWQVGDREAGAQPITGDIYHAGIWKEYLSSLECIDLYVKALNRRNRV